MSGAATLHAVRGGIVRRRLQTGVVAFVVLISTASTVVALALVVNSEAPFDHAFAKQRGADIVATFAPNVATASLTGTARIPGVTAASGPYGEVRVTGTSDGMSFEPQTLVGRATPGGPVDDLVIQDGHWATQRGQVVLATGDNGSGLGFSVGSTMIIGAGAHRQTLTVVGLANSITGSASGWVAPAELPLLRAAGGTSASQMLYRFADARIGAPLHADVARLKAALPDGALAGTMSYYTAKVEQDGNIAPFVPFLLAFGILGIVMSVLIVANVVSGAVVSGYRRIGILKSIGFTPLQVTAAYAAQVALPALLGCLAGVVAGNLLATPLLRQNATAYGVGRLGVPIWVDVVVPVGICTLAAVAALLPALRASRLSSVQAIAIGRAPQAGRGYAAHRLLGPLPLPRPLTIGLAAPFARPSRTLLTLAAILLGATAVTFAVGLSTSLKRLLDGISHQRAEPVRIEMPGRGFNGGGRIKVGPKRFHAAPPTSPVTEVPTATAERKILAAVHAEPATLHVVAEAEDDASVSGLSDQTQVTAFRGSATWTGYDLVSGRWYSGPNEVLVPTGFLKQTGKAVGDTISLAEGRKLLRVRIVGEIFDTHNRGLNLVTSWATLRQLHPGVVPDQFDVGLRPGSSAKAYVNAVSRRLGPAYDVESNSSGPAVVAAMIGLIGTLAALLAAVAALGVLNTVVLNTRERVRDIGIFKAVGMTPRQTTAMAISWVAGIGLVAGLIAVPLGVALHHEILPAMAGSVGLRLPASYLSVYGTTPLIALAFAGVLIAVIGALAPATWAARIQTATALHTE